MRDKAARAAGRRKIMVGGVGGPGGLPPGVGGPEGVGGAEPRNPMEDINLDALEELLPPGGQVRAEMQEARGDFKQRAGNLAKAFTGAVRTTAGVAGTAGMEGAKNVAMGAAIVSKFYAGGALTVGGLLAGSRGAMEKGMKLQGANGLSPREEKIAAWAEQAQIGLTVGSVVCKAGSQGLRFLAGKEGQGARKRMMAGWLDTAGNTLDQVAQARAEESRRRRM